MTPPARPPVPRLVAALLDWGATRCIAQLAVCGAYLLGGVVKLADFQGAVAEQAHFGMAPPAFFAGLTILVELVGPALILSGRLVWLGAGMLGAFTALAAITANPFWRLHGPARFDARNAFFEHLGLIGGFVLIAILARRQPETG